MIVAAKKEQPKLDDTKIEETIQEINRQVALVVFGIPEPEENYAGTYDGAWIVIHRMKKEGGPDRLKFFQTIQALATKGAGIDNGVLGWPDVLFYATPLTICLAALSTIVGQEPKLSTHGQIIPFGKKKNERPC